MLKRGPCLLFSNQDPTGLFLDYFRFFPPLLLAALWQTKEAEARTKSKQEELEKLKQRLACKMEIVNFYGGCCEAFGKMTAAQNKQLQRKLQSCSASDLHEVLCPAPFRCAPV